MLLAVIVLATLTGDMQQVCLLYILKDCIVLKYFAADRSAMFAVIKATLYVCCKIILKF